MALKDLETRFIEDLLNKRIIYLEGGIDQEAAKNVGKALLWLNTQDSTKEITLYIDSVGGNVEAGLDIVDMIKHISAPVMGIVYRSANSMAAVILQSCSKRKAMRQSDILIHDTTVPAVTLAEIEENPDKVLKRAKESQQRIYQILSERSGKNIEEIKKLCKEDKRLSAYEALELGFIDEVI